MIKLNINKVKKKIMNRVTRQVKLKEMLMKNQSIQVNLKNKIPLLQTSTNLRKIKAQQTIFSHKHGILQL